jgi:hypothetical protein
MKGLDTRCTKAPDDNLEGTSCCIHLRVRKGDYICCWCGNLFMGDDNSFPEGRHGQYRPRRERRR